MKSANNPECHKQIASGGFTLLETLIALFILVFGLMIGTELIHLALTSGSLARTKGCAALVAESKLAYLMDLYRRNPKDADLSIGGHGPEEVQILNPAAGLVLNRFHVSWTVDAVSDPRPGISIRARSVSVTVMPVDAEGKRHIVNRLNKVLVLPAILSARPQ